MQIAANPNDLDIFLNQWRKNFLLEKVMLNEAKDWKIEEGILRHETGGFFNVVGVSYENDVDKVFLYQPQSAVTGLLVSYFDGQMHVLLQARAEPGTQGIAQYGPTIQSTLANYMGLHGGQLAHYTDHFIRYHASIRSVIHDSEQLDLGERYVYKSKRLVILACDPDIEIEDQFIWVPETVIKDSIKNFYFFNTDLRSLFAVLPWSCMPGVAISLAPLSRFVNASLVRPVNPNVIGAVCAKLSTRIAPCNFTELNKLKNWDISDNGFYEIKNLQGFAIEFYYCEVFGREVRSWFQPLVNSHGTGYAALYCREVNGALEILIRIGAESGLKTGQALLPTVLNYPNCIFPLKPPVGEILASTMESDEGGRFLRDINKYELVLVPYDCELTDDLLWISISELKWFLSNSNLCAIQLRGLSSLLLGELPC